jgi:predicted RNase H-like HicB family nuclease
MKTGVESNLWILIERAADVPGEWVAHCLDFDVVTQGRSLQHAFEMLKESVAMVVADDLKVGRDPLDRRAPKAEWDHLWAAVKRGEKRPRGEPLPADDSKVEFVVAQLVFVLQHVSTSKTKRPKRNGASEQIPLALAGYSE